MAVWSLFPIGSGDLDEIFAGDRKYIQELLDALNAIHAVTYTMLDSSWGRIVTTMDNRSGFEPAGSYATSNSAGGSIADIRAHLTNILENAYFYDSGMSRFKSTTLLDVLDGGWTNAAFMTAASGRTILNELQEVIQWIADNIYIEGAFGGTPTNYPPAQLPYTQAWLLEHLEWTLRQATEWTEAREAMADDIRLMIDDWELGNQEQSFPWASLIFERALYHWYIGNHYNQYEWEWHDGHKWKAYLAHTANAGNEPGIGEFSYIYWEDLGEEENPNSGPPWWNHRSIDDIAMLFAGGHVYGCPTGDWPLEYKSGDAKLWASLLGIRPPGLGGAPKYVINIQVDVEVEEINIGAFGNAGGRHRDSILDFSSYLTGAGDVTMIQFAPDIDDYKASIVVPEDRPQPPEDDVAWAIEVGYSATGGPSGGGEVVSHAGGYTQVFRCDVDHTSGGGSEWQSEGTYHPGDRVWYSTGPNNDAWIRNSYDYPPAGDGGIPSDGSLHWNKDNDEPDIGNAWENYWTVVSSGVYEGDVYDGHGTGIVTWSSPKNIHIMVHPIITL